MAHHEEKALADLTWQARWVSLFPGDPEPRNFTRPVRNALYSFVNPTPVTRPSLLGWSESLAQDLGIDKPLAESPSLNLLAGNLVLPEMKPYASRYGGHQFGNWAGQLGDGRAISLGEVVTGEGKRFEFQLKGAGPTPYSRRADGRAVLRSSVREFLCSEAMHSLGVPTTRALSVILTGEDVVRDLFYDGNPRPEPGAIVCRVSPSFVRFGNFEILAAQNEVSLLTQLLETVTRDHYPEIIIDAPDLAARFLDEVARRTAVLMAHWMRVGFVHGVMNTDNLSVLGLTIDYGPYGWLDSYDPNWTPNTTDSENRRYRYSNQPAIALWNLARLGEALTPLIPEESRIEQSLNLYRTTFETTYSSILSAKIGFVSLESEENQEITQNLFRLLQLHETDFTLFFRLLGDWKIEVERTESEAGADFLQLITPAFYELKSVPESLLAEWVAWSLNYSRKLREEKSKDSERGGRMNAVNPKYILRNYIAQNAITAAEQGDPSLIDRLLRVLKNPYTDQPGEEEFAMKRPEWARNAAGCSALSCSS